MRRSPRSENITFAVGAVAFLAVVLVAGYFVSTWMTSLTPEQVNYSWIQTNLNAGQVASIKYSDTTRQVQTTLTNGDQYTSLLPETVAEKQMREAATSAGLVVQPTSAFSILLGSMWPWLLMMVMTLSLTYAGVKLAGQKK